MCGIAAYVGRREAAPVLLEGLARLGYRGYDSAGVAVTSGSGKLRVHKAAGRVRALAESAPKSLKGRAGIAHTRWATHGEPSDVNAHPHLDATGRFALVHNGIVENAPELRDALLADGVTLMSQTDSELLVALLARTDADTLAERLRRVLLGVVGAYGIAAVERDRPGEVVVARNGSPIVVGIGEHEMLAASDVAAIVRHTDRVVHLDDGEVATLTAEDFRTMSLDARPGAPKQSARVEHDEASYALDGHADHMAKEIAEQGDVVRAALRGRLDRWAGTARLDGLPFDAATLRGIGRVKLLGCGSAYYAARLGAGIVERLARIPATAEPASEFRYRDAVIEPDCLYVAISQSGETIDTLAAVEEIRRKGGRVVGVVNVVGSSIARACESGVYLHAGPEISVTSTKTFTATAVCLSLIALQLGRVRDLGRADAARLLDALERLPEDVEAALGVDVGDAVAQLDGATSALFVGRLAGHVVAQEGAQKLKEVAYVHAEAYPASELKHGPLALVDERMPVVAVLPDDPVLDKNLSTVAQVRARGGRVMSVGHREHDEVDGPQLVVPASLDVLDPIVLGIPLQLLAYEAAVARGLDVDRPRNLAKSVTTE